MTRLLLNKPRLVGNGQPHPLTSGSGKGNTSVALCKDSSESLAEVTETQRQRGRFGQESLGGPGTSSSGAAINFTSGPLAFAFQDSPLHSAGSDPTVELVVPTVHPPRPIDHVALARDAVAGGPVEITIAELGGGQYVSDAFIALQNEPDSQATVISAQSPYHSHVSAARYGDTGTDELWGYVRYDRIASQLRREREALGEPREGVGRMVVVNSAVTDLRGGVATVGLSWEGPDGTQRTLLARARLTARDVLQQKHDLAGLCLHWARLLREGHALSAITAPRPKLYEASVEFVELHNEGGEVQRIGRRDPVTPLWIGERDTLTRDDVREPPGLTTVQKNVFWLNARSGFRISICESGATPVGLSQRFADLPFCAIYQASYDAELEPSKGPRATPEQVLDAMQVSDNRGRAAIDIRTDRQDGNLVVTGNIVVRSPRHESSATTVTLSLPEGHPYLRDGIQDEITTALIRLIREQRLADNALPNPGMERPVP